MSLRRFAILTASLTYVLLLLGGLVHNTRSSLACPDWPLCFGQVFPKMEGGVLVEHSHRLVAASVSLLAAALMIWAWLRVREEADRALAWLATGAFALVLTQAVLGGLTVIFRLPTLVSTAHLAVSQLFFISLIYLAFRAPGGDGAAAAAAAPLSRKVQRTTLAGVIAVYLQMILGALMRHLGAGLACNTDVVMCQGKLWPTGVHPNVTLHVVHRLFAYLVFGHLVSMSIVVWRNTNRGGLRALALAAPLLVVVQVALGMLSITTFLDAVPVTAHLGVASALLADCVILHIVARGAVAVRSDSATPVAAVEVAA
jgi:heme A synthase